jgi:hypothetical protein
VTMGKNEGLVRNLVDEMGDWKLHRNKRAQMRAVEFQESLEGGQVSFLHADDEFVLFFIFSHLEVYPEHRSL